MEAEHENEAAAELQNTAASPSEYPTADEEQEVVSVEQRETVLREDDPVGTENETSKDSDTPVHFSCLTVQPNRVLCGVRRILLHYKKSKTTLIWIRAATRECNIQH